MCPFPGGPETGPTLPYRLGNFLQAVQYKPHGGNCTSAEYIGSSKGTKTGIESKLHVEYIEGVGQGATTWVYSYPSFDFFADHLKWSSDFTSGSDHPHVSGLSYGSHKIDFCGNTRSGQDV